MERRVAGIIRWLERCIKAYKDGAVENALMDAECARADMETLRGELWEKLERRFSAPTRRFNFFKPAELLLCAFGILLITATPLALHRDEPAGEGRVHTLEWVTPDERELLSNLRRRPDEPLAALKAEEPDAPALKPEEPVIEPSVAAPERIEPVRATAPARRGNPEPQASRSEQREPETSLNYDRILSLIETGERAMKNETPAIRVESER